MIEIKLPSGHNLSCKSGINGAEIAAQISKTLAKKALVVEIDGQLCDLSTPINKPSAVRIITVDDVEGLEIIRHDTAHVLAQAIKELYPQAQITIGPNVRDGFYYDIDTGGVSISSEDLAKIEERMRQIIKRGEKFIRKVVSKDEAVAHFAAMGENYKVEIIRDLPDDQPISVYYQGEFSDLCRGPHGTSTAYLRAFKLTKVAGAYWRGDSRNQMLQRIYGTAWRNNEELQQHLTMLEEAEKRDHRRLGALMGLYHFQDVAPGVVFWHPKGWAMFQTLVGYMRRQQAQHDYREIATPEIMERTLWEHSGHWEKFHENMFVAQTHDEEDRSYVVKPMNCPGCVQIFNHLEGVCSYRQLPIRLSEFGKVYRYEPSGALHGLMRARGFTQDDAHVFCTEAQIQSEVVDMCQLLFQVYADCGFESIQVKLADRPEKRIGSDAVWDQAESALAAALDSIGVSYELNKGEGAFYGPKIEFQLRDAIGRDWQMGTVQVDLNMPGRLGAYYIDEDGKKQCPVMIHRAIFGSLERFIAIMIEHYAGWLPLWLAPTQVVLVTVSNRPDVVEYAKVVKKELLQAGVRLELDDDNETVGYKIRKHTTAKVPLLVTIGANEMASGRLSVRDNLAQRQAGAATVEVSELSVAELLRSYRFNPPA